MFDLMNIQKLVTDELTRRKWTTYQLWKAVEAEVKKQTVYDFVNGKTAMRSDQLGHVLEALGFELKRKR